MPYVVKKLNEIPIYEEYRKKKENQDLKAFKLRFISVSSWSADELHFMADINDLNKLSNTRKYLLAAILIFFKDGDKIIIDNCNAGFPSLFANENINMDFLSYEDRRNAIEWYGFQTANEITHNISYNDAINCYYINNKEFREIFDKVYPIMQEKLKILKDFVNNSISSTNSMIENKVENNKLIAEHMLNFILVEGIGFHSNFSLIFYFKSINVMHTLTKQNNFIHRDEGYHAKFALELILSSGLIDYLDKSYVIDTIKKIVELECVYLDTIGAILAENNSKSYTIKSLSFDGLKCYIKSLGNEISQKLINLSIYDIDHTLIPSYVKLAEASTIANGIEIKNNNYSTSTKLTNEELKHIYDTDIL